jgi:hypothetical protein
VNPPSHCDRDMYHDTYDGQDMRRWLCAEPGCNALVTDDQLAAIRDLIWAESHPGWTTLGWAESHPGWTTFGGVS